MYRRVPMSPGTNPEGRFCCDAAYEDEQGNRVHLKVSLDRYQDMPDECEYPPSGSGIEVKEWKYAVPPVTSVRK